MSDQMIYWMLCVCLVVLLSLCTRAWRVYKKAVDLNPLFQDKSMLEQDIHALRRTLSSENNKLKNLGDRIAEANDRIERGEQMKKYLEDNRDQESHLRKRIAQCQNDLDNVNKLYEKCNQNCQQLQKECAEASLELQSVKDERNKIGKELAELKTSRTYESSEIARLQKEKKGLDERLDPKRRELARVEEELRQKQEDFQKYRSQLLQAKEEKGSLMKEVKELREERSKLQNSVSQLKLEKVKTETILDAVHGEQRRLEDVKKHCWDDLDAPLPNIIKGKPVTQEEESWYENFQQNMSDCGIVFPERLIHAFHTSLKVQDSSPLVVLAGISGTGKSLLPELYAKAVGMNFLQVAVQPRWDSSQDMLGFYNYMESRFKATELSRMLWQSDRYNNAKNAHSSMNIVLLDEMNLARVEYYFSDMLSKLEVRRGIDPENEAMRHAAEIEIECGTASDLVGRRRLYIDRNTLFVGTMNEDETTQSLSDKVLDRANMIRFGRPKELVRTSVRKEEFLGRYSDERASMMTLEQWDVWCRKTENPHMKELRATLERLNQMLETVGRPFGHRVWQGVVRYVGNYPKRDETGFHWALADQLEMKILPKLSGLDKDQREVKDVLSAIHDEIFSHDEELALAFSAAANNKNSVFFQWKGLSR